jgi:tetratricopeptide (TPR) repeat protein
MGSSFEKPVIWIARRVVPWALDHPFAMRPRWWAAALGAWFAITGFLFVVGVKSLVLSLALGLLFAFIIAGTIGWFWISSVSEKSAVAVTRFAADTPTAHEAAHYHRAAVLERLRSSLVGDHLDLRPWHVAVNRRQAERLLDHVPARAAIFGRVRAISGAGTWELELLMRWPGDEDAPAHIEPGEDDDLLVVEEFDRRVRAPDRHEAILEFDTPLSRLIAERFESDHVDRIEGTMLVLLAAVASREGDDALMAEAFRAANQVREKLSARTRAALEITRAVVEVEHFATVADLLDSLEEAGLRDAGHVDLWNFLTSLAYVALVNDEISPDRRAAFAQHAVDADPSNGTARYNLGEVFMASDQHGRALTQFAAAVDDPEYADRHYAHLARGIAAYNAGQNETARDSYARAVELRPSARGHLYLGDAHRRIGDEDQARANYLRALKLQPALADALRGYWCTEDPAVGPPPPPPWMDAVFLTITRLPLVVPRTKIALRYRLLRRHYRRHPEDARIHFMLGTHAALLLRLDEAEERLQFAYDVMWGADLPALARLSLVWALKGEPEKAREGVVRIREAPNIVTSGPPTEQELVERAFDLLSPLFELPELTVEPGAEEFHETVVDVFPEASDPDFLLAGITSEHLI